MIQLATGRKADPAEYLLGALTHTQLNFMFSHYNRHPDRLKEGLASSWSFFVGQLVLRGGRGLVTAHSWRVQVTETRAAGSWGPRR